MKVTMEEISAFEEFRARINKASLEDIELYENGERVEFSRESLDRWKYIGLSNMDYLRHRWFDKLGTTPSTGK